MEILYVKLTWFCAESHKVILVLYFTLICGVTCDAPRWISANIQMKAPPKCPGLSLLIVQRRVGVPEWQLNYAHCVSCKWVCVVYVLWAFGGMRGFCSVVRECQGCISQHRREHIVHNHPKFTDFQILLISKLDMNRESRTERFLMTEYLFL